MRTILALGGAAILAACSQARTTMSVDEAWVRLAAVTDRPAVAYFTVHGGPTPATLINVTADVAIRSEMHESMQSGSMASMKPIARVAIPANADVAFGPGGRHVMLYGLNPVIKPGGRAVMLTLTFADGTRLMQNATVVGAGDPAPQ